MCNICHTHGNYMNTSEPDVLNPWAHCSQISPWTLYFYDIQVWLSSKITDVITDGVSHCLPVSLGQKT